MSRKRTGRRRGRPRKAHAKRRTTTRIGRRTGSDPVDTGTQELLARKLRATTRPDLEASAIGVLYGRALIDARQYQILSELTLALQRLAREMPTGGNGPPAFTSTHSSRTPRIQRSGSSSAAL